MASAAHRQVIGVDGVLIIKTRQRWRPQIDGGSAAGVV